MTGQVPKRQEFQFHPWENVKGALLGLLLLVGGAALMTHGLLLLMQQEGIKPLLKDGDPAWVSGLESLIGLSLAVIGLYCLWRTWQQSGVRIRIEDEALLIVQRGGVRRIPWSEIELVHEIQVKLQPGRRSDLIKDEFAVKHFREYFVYFKDRKRYSLQGIKSVTLLVGLLAIQAERHQIPWKITKENRNSIFPKI